MKRDSHWDETVDRPWIGKIEALGRKAVYGIFAGLFGSKPGRKFDFKNVKKILLVKEPYRMGDLFQVTPTLRALKEWNPELKVGLVVQDRNALIFENSPHVDFLYLYEKRRVNRNPFSLIPFLGKIRREKFDLTVTLETQRCHLTNDLIAFFSGAPFRLRYDGQAFGNSESNSFYNLLTPFDWSRIHQVDKNFSVFKPYGPPLKDRSLFLKLSQSHLDNAAKALSKLGFPAGSGFTLIHPGSYKIGNRWPLGNYIEVAKALKSKGRNVAFVLGPSEKNWKGELEREGFSVVTDISILDMAGLFGLSEQVVCNDTGVMHIAGAVGVKTLALFGETNPDEWKPPNPSVRHIRTADKKISSIKVGDVLELIY